MPETGTGWQSSRSKLAMSQGATVGRKSEWDPWRLLSRLREREVALSMMPWHFPARVYHHVCAHINNHFSQTTDGHPTCSMRKHQQVSSGLREPPVRTAEHLPASEIRPARNQWLSPAEKFDHPGWLMLSTHISSPARTLPAMEVHRQPRSQRAERKNLRKDRNQEIDVLNGTVANYNNTWFSWIPMKEWAKP